MSAVIDHLEAGRVITVLRPFHDLAGALHPVGETGRLLHIQLNWGAQHASFALEAPDGSKFGFSLDTRAETGPASGRMREYFSIADAAAPPPDPPTALAAGNPVPAAPSREEWPHDLYSPEVAAITGQALRGEIEQAEAEFTLLMRKPNVFAGYLPIIAAELEAAASAQATPASGPSFEWIYDKAIECLYRWAGQATSGGEGTAMMYEVKSAEKRREALRRRIAAG